MTISLPQNTSAARPGASIRKIRQPGLQATILGRDGIREFHVTIWPLPGERPAGVFWRLNLFLRQHQASVVWHQGFGPVEIYHEGVVQEWPGGAWHWPLTWVEGASCTPDGMAGMHVFAVANAAVTTVSLDGAVIGRAFGDRWARHCLLGNIRPTELRSANTDQAAQVYHQLERALGFQGMVLSDTARTWLFLDNILDWYGPFNTVRTEIFTQRNVFARGVPASTGIGAKNPFGAALVAGAWAVQPLDGPMRVLEVRSPLQCSARSYGSCFSRAVEMIAPGHRRLLVSGTASIAADGRTARTGDLLGQIQFTMDVVQAILRSRKMDWPSVTRATVYLKRKTDGTAFKQWCAQHRRVLPLIITQADICRDDLLFEIEVDAIVPTSVEAASELEA